MITRWCQSTWCLEAEFHLHPRLDPVVVCSSVYRKLVSDFFLFFLVLFFLTHFHSRHGYSNCFPVLSCYSVTHFYYYRCCISCYPVLLLYILLSSPPAVYLAIQSSCCISYYPVLLLYILLSSPPVVYLAIQSSCCILLSSPPDVSCNLFALLSLTCVSLPSTALFSNSLLSLSLLYALLHISTSATVTLIPSSVQFVCCFVTARYNFLPSHPIICPIRYFSCRNPHS
jgi:hypothetical protein